MRKVQLIPVTKLKLDLNNFRTVPQTDEIKATQAMMSIKPGKFWGLLQSILDHKFEETENLIVMENGDGYLVKEGNRRTACLKLILGLISMESVDLPASKRAEIRKKDNLWKADLQEVPCVVFTAEEKEHVDRIVDRTHGKGEEASRAEWEAVAKARHNKANGYSEPGLELLEAYLKHGNNGITDAQRVRWAGEYKLTILDDFVSRYYKRLGFVSSKDFVAKYPDLGDLRKPVEEILFRIGLESVGFAEIRDDELGTYGIPAEAQKPNTNTDEQPTGGTNGNDKNASPADNNDQPNDKGSNGLENDGPDDGKNTPVGSGKNLPGNGELPKPKPRGRNKAAALTDPKSVKKLLRGYHPRGKDRGKLVDLNEEAKILKIETTPFAFCFVLRSMFEIAAKTYCEQNNIDLMDGKYEASLAKLLRRAHTKLTENSPALHKALQASLRELDRKEEGLLSVTTMNKLVHCKIMKASTDDICVTFHQIFPLLDHMTR